MLLSLKRDIQNDLHSSVAKLNIQSKTLEERTDHVERKMGEFVKTVIKLVDCHYEQSEDIQRLKDKVADLEDRSCRNNLKLREVPETVTLPDLVSYIQDLLKLLLPEDPNNFLIDRAH